MRVRVWMCLAIGLVALSVTMAGCDIDSNGRSLPVGDATSPREAPRGTKRSARSMVASFMDRRVAGRGAEKFLAADGRDEFRPGGSLAPMYPKPRLKDFEIVFVDGPLGGPFYEVGVELQFQSGSYGDTLFVALDGDRYVITGGRPGLEGP